MTEPLRTLIVDDEPAARRRLALLCAELPQVRVVGDAADGRQALAVLEREAIDLLLLDIEMPGLDGMALARLICDRPQAPAIVFVTAFDSFAVAAFGVHAAGYLLKPVDPDLLARLVTRIAAAPRPSHVAVPDTEVFWAPHRGELVRVSADELDWIAGEGDYVRLHAGARSFLLAERLYALESRLDPRRFARAHRSAIVRLDRVVGLKHAGAGAWAVTLATGDSLPIGRSHLAALRAALGM